MGDISCEMPDSNPAAGEIKNILESYKVIAVVGLSGRPERDSNRVAVYLKNNGYKIIPVNPSESKILDEKCYPDLQSIPVPVDIVNIFRKVDAIPKVIDDAIVINAKAVWLQLGLAHNESAKKARRAGLDVVQAKCIKIEHTRLFSEN